MGLTSDIYIPLTVKIIRFLNNCKDNKWVGHCDELAREIMIELSDDKWDLGSQIVHAIQVLKEEGMLTNESGFVINRKDKIILQLAG